MKMGCFRVTGLAGESDDLAALDELALLNSDARKMHVERLEAQSMIDNDRLAIISRLPYEAHDAAIDGEDGRSLGVAEVSALMGDERRACRSRIAVGVGDKRRSSW